MTTNTKQRVTVFLHTNLVKYAKTQAIVEDSSLTELVEKALISYLPKKTVIKRRKIKNVKRK